MSVPVFSGLSDVADQYDHFIIDVWGVLHDGQKAYPTAVAAMKYLQDAGKQVLLLSNSPNRASRVVEKVLTPIGIPANTYHHILTSGEAAHHHMLAHHAGQKVYSFWDDEDPTAIHGIDMTRVYDIAEADFIYGSLVPYDAVADMYTETLARALSQDMPFVCGNPDRVVGHGDSLHLCVGALAESYEAMGGNVTWIGKPHRPIYDQAWDMLGQPDKDKILAIGDGIVTDLAGASGFGCDVIWNAVGIHWDEIQTNHTIDQEKVANVLHGQPEPVGILHGFQI